MPENIKKETIDNETAENKAEEIEIEGADEESTQAAEEAKDTDVNETESDDDALADADAKADDKSDEKSDEKKGLFKKKKKDKKDEQIEELNDRLKRQMAEFENFRKRSEKEKSQMFDMGAKTIVVFYQQNVCTCAACAPHPSPLPKGARGPSRAMFSSFSERERWFPPRPFGERVTVRT